MGSRGNNNQQQQQMIQQPPNPVTQHIKAIFQKEQTRFNAVDLDICKLQRDKVG